MNYIFILLFGIIIGSFLNVCIYRIPRGESISYPSSHCTNCNHKLGVLDLIPVLSYIFLKGRCRYCKEKISFIYPLVEFLNAILYLIFYVKYGGTIGTAKYFILVSLLIVVSVIDFNTQYVYTSTTIFGLLVGIVFIINEFIYSQEGLNSILGGVVGAIIIGLIVFTTKGMGEGDIEIAAVCGLFLGIKGILLALFLSIILGGISGVIVLLLKFKNAKDKMAFGPFIAIGAVIVALYGNEIINAYFKLLI